MENGKINRVRSNPTQSGQLLTEGQCPLREQMKNE